VPSGGLLIPTIGVGGHCLPKDGILLLWRQIESGMNMDDSLILESRRINDESPAETIRRTEKAFGQLDGQCVALMGAAYRFNSEDTRNSPTLPLSQLLIDRGCKVVMHDPYVKPEDEKLRQFKLQNLFTRDIETALSDANVAIFCTAHRIYADDRERILNSAAKLTGVFDGCNLYKKTEFGGNRIGYAGIGRGGMAPSGDFVDFVFKSFRIMERGVANELQAYIEFASLNYSKDDFNRLNFREVQQIAGTCVTGCDIGDPGPIETAPEYLGYVPRLVQCAKRALTENKYK
jgi:hypothetical protein